MFPSAAVTSAAVASSSSASSSCLRSAPAKTRRALLVAVVAASRLPNDATCAFLAACPVRSRGCCPAGGRRRAAPTSAPVTTAITSRTSRLTATSLAEPPSGDRSREGRHAVELVVGHRVGEQVALPEPAAECVEAGELVGVLDALGDDGQRQHAADADD